MKISVITFHNTSNFGATLQCAALSAYLKKQGHDVEVVNYLPSYVLDKKSIAKELRKIGTAKNKIRAAVKGIAYLLYFRDVRRRDARFEEFIDRHLSLTEPYYSSAELDHKVPRADLYICGSDQIWNPALTGGALDPAFFLRFAPGKKAAYGVSLGELNTAEYGESLKKLTQDFTAVSVRERSVVPSVSAAIGREVSVVLDCTLLLSKEDYASMETEGAYPPEPYLLLYNVQNSAESVRIAKQEAARRGLSIIDISPNPFSRVEGAGKQIDIGPGEFLSYIRHADFVVTNSFHGTVFSVIYKKQFYSVPHSTRGGRSADLLALLDLSSRLIKSAEDAGNEPVSYETAEQKLSLLQEQSKSFLAALLNP